MFNKIKGRVFNKIILIFNLTKEVFKILEESKILKNKNSKKLDLKKFSNKWLDRILLLIEFQLFNKYQIKSVKKV